MTFIFLLLLLFLHRIIHAINDLGYKVAFDNADSVRLVSDTVAVEIWDLTKATDDVIVGLELKLDGGESVPVLNPWDLVSLFESASPSYTETDAAIFLPGEFVRKVQQGRWGLLSSACTSTHTLALTHAHLCTKIIATTQNKTTQTNNNSKKHF